MNNSDPDPTNGWYKTSSPFVAEDMFLKICAQVFTTFLVCFPVFPNSAEGKDTQGSTERGRGGREGSTGGRRGGGGEHWREGGRRDGRGGIV